METQKLPTPAPRHYPRSPAWLGPARQARELGGLAFAMPAQPPHPPPISSNRRASSGNWGATTSIIISRCAAKQIKDLQVEGLYHPLVSPSRRRLVAESARQRARAVCLADPSSYSPGRVKPPLCRMHVGLLGDVAYEIEVAVHLRRGGHSGRRRDRHKSPLPRRLQHARGLSGGNVSM
jgi:hypothetical protein